MTSNNKEEFNKDNLIKFQNLCKTEKIKFGAKNALFRYF